MSEFNNELMKVEPSAPIQDIKIGELPPLRIWDREYKPTVQRPLPFYRSQKTKRSGGVLDKARDRFGPAFPVLNPGAWVEVAVDVLDSTVEEVPAGSLDTLSADTKAINRRQAIRYLIGGATALTLGAAGLGVYKTANELGRRLTGNRNYNLLNTFGRWLLRGPEVTEAKTELSAEMVLLLLQNQNEERSVQDLAASLYYEAVRTIKKDPTFSIDDRASWRDTPYEIYFGSLYEAVTTLLNPRDRQQLINSVSGLKDPKTIKKEEIITAVESFNTSTSGKVLTLNDLLNVLENRYGYRKDDKAFVYLVYRIGLGELDPRTGSTLTSNGEIIGLRYFLNEYLSRG